MVQPDQFEAFYAAHPSVPKTIVRKIYEWKVSRDPDIFPLYYDRSVAYNKALDVRTFHAPETALASTSPPLTLNPCGLGSSMMPGARKQEPIILTFRNRQSRPV